MCKALTTPGAGDGAGWGSEGRLVLLIIVVLRIFTERSSVPWDFLACTTEQNFSGKGKKVQSYTFGEEGKSPSSQLHPAPFPLHVKKQKRVQPGSSFHSHPLGTL